jgi:hypothetical protein
MEDEWKGSLFGKKGVLRYEIFWNCDAGLAGAVVPSSRSAFTPEAP